MASRPSLNILFLCSAHNSLSQLLWLVLQEQGHGVTVELAINDETMIEATRLAKPDLIICPFLTKKVPAAIYDSVLTLIVHPGAPGDAGPSALDWVLLGDDGIEADPKLALEKISTNEHVGNGLSRSHWGVTVLQAIEEFDAGPVWAFDQFPLTLNGPIAPTKSSLYRGPVTKAAVACCLAAVDRIVAAAEPTGSITPSLVADKSWSRLSVTTGEPFLGGQTRTRPLLKPTERAWDPAVHSAEYAARRLCASDSQPGVQSNLFGRNLYLYGGIVEENPIPFNVPAPGRIVAQRAGAVLVSTADGKGIWITHVRRLKPKTQSLLPAKLPAMLGLAEVPEVKESLKLDAVPEWRLEGFKKREGTFQEVYIEYIQHSHVKTAYVYFDFYNGANSTFQCKHLLEAIREATSETSSAKAVVLMGGSYWSNGINLSVVSTDIAKESWHNINAINDCVKAILETRNVITFAAIRGNAAAGGLALATCCDFVLASKTAVLNPHYRAVGLYGSEYHSLTWYARAGEERARAFMRGMLPMSPTQAKAINLVDYVIDGQDIDSGVRSRVGDILSASTLNGLSGAPWVKGSDWRTGGPESIVDSILAMKAAWFNRLPQSIEAYRQQELDFMKLTFTDPRYHACVAAFVGKLAPKTTALRFALHRRHAHWKTTSLDPEEALNYFDYVGYDSAAINSKLGLDDCPILPSLPPPLAWRPLVVKTSRGFDETNRKGSSLSVMTLCERCDNLPFKVPPKSNVNETKQGVAEHQMSCYYSEVELTA